MLGEYYPLWFDYFRMLIIPTAFLISVGILIYRQFFTLRVYNLNIEPHLQTILLQKRKKIKNESK